MNAIGKRVFATWLLAVLVGCIGTTQAVASHDLSLYFTIGGTYHWPLDGELDATDDLWINTETWPDGSASTVEVVYSADGGSSWFVADMTWNGTTPGWYLHGQANTNDVWHVNLGTFPEGTTIQYALVATKYDGAEIWDNNGGEDFLATVNPGGPVNSVGNTYHLPLDGEIDEGDNLWIYSETSPVGWADGVDVVYSTDGGSTWAVAPMSANGSNGDHDVWSVNLGTFPRGTTIQYAVAAEDLVNDVTIWDNNGGADYLAIVNP